MKNQREIKGKKYISIDHRSHSTREANQNKAKKKNQGSPSQGEKMSKRLVGGIKGCKYKTSLMAFARVKISLLGCVWNIFNV